MRCFAVLLLRDKVKIQLHFSSYFARYVSERIGETHVKKILNLQRCLKYTDAGDDINKNECQTSVTYRLVEQKKTVGKCGVDFNHSL